MDDIKQVSLHPTTVEKKASRVSFEKNATITTIPIKWVVSLLHIIFVH